MKKILLIPLLAMSILTGCEQKENEPSLPKVTLTEWLSDLGFADGHFFNMDIITQGNPIMPDYNNVMSEYIKGKTKDIEGKKISTPRPRALLTYYVGKEHYPFDFCAIYIHEDRIETSASTPYTYDNKKMHYQHYEYKINAEIAIRIVAKAYQRVEQINQIHKDEIELARAESSPENFFKIVEESSKAPTVTLYGESSTEDITIEDTDKVYLEDLKALEYEPTVYSGSKMLLTYRPNDDIAMIIYRYTNNKCIADMEISYKSSLGYNKALSFRYYVSEEQVNQLINKIKTNK